MSKVIDMTKGHPIKLMLLFTIPLLIGNLFQQFYSMVDTMIAGYYIGEEAIAAIGATSSIFSLTIGFAIGMNSGYGIILSTYVGEKNVAKIKDGIQIIFLLNLIIGTLITLALCILLPTILNLLHTPSGIWQLTYDYIFIIAAGLMTILLYNMFAGIMRSFGNSKIPLYFLIIACILNVILDVTFVVYWNMGIKGAALATVISQGASAFGSGYYVYTHYKEYMPAKESIKFPKPMVYSMLRSGFSMAFILCVVNIGTVILQSGINSLGTQNITAFTAARRLMEMLMQPLGSLCTAFSIFVAQNWGAKNPKRILSSLKYATLLECLWTLIAIGIILLWGKNFIQMITGIKNPQTLQLALLNLRINLFFFPALGVLLSIRTLLQGIGKSQIPVISSTIELAFKVFATIYLIPKYQFLGASIAEPITWVLCSIFMLVYFIPKRKKLIFFY